MKNGATNCVKILSRYSARGGLVSETPSAPSFERTWTKYSRSRFSSLMESMITGDFRPSSFKTGAAAARSRSGKLGPDFLASRLAADAGVAPTPTAPARKLRRLTHIEFTSRSSFLIYTIFSLQLVQSRDREGGDPS